MILSLFLSSLLLNFALGDQAAQKPTLNEINQEAETALDNGSISKAVALYENFLKDNPQNAEAMFYLAGIYGKAGNFEKEEDLCQKAIAIDPNSPDYYVNLGNAQAGLKKWTQAQQSFQTAYKLATEQKNKFCQIHASYSLSNYFLEIPEQNNAEAIRWSDTCIDHLPKSVVDGKGLFSGYLGEFRKNNQRLFWTYESATLNKAGALGNIMEFKKAKAILTDYIQKYPQSQNAQAMLHSMSKRS